jgi:RND family efflux transporter MFP subunit
MSSLKPGYKIFLIIALMFVLPITMNACRDREASNMGASKRPVVAGVTMSKIVPTRVEDYYETSGTVRAKATSTISSRIMGTVTSIPVREGDRVKAGQLLLTLDDRETSQKVTAAEHTLEAAAQNKELTDNTYRRYKKLYDEKALSGQEIDQMETQAKVAASEYHRVKASLEEAKVYQNFSRIVSPFSGWITEKKVDEGDMAVPGTPLLVVESGSGFNIEAAVDEALSGKLRAGMPADIEINAIGLIHRGTIIEVVPTVERLSRTFTVKISVADPKLKSGLFAKVMIPFGEKDIILIPRNSLVEKGQLTGIYAVNADGTITYRLVRAGKLFGNSVEILSGIVAGDIIITGGMEKAVDGGMLASGKSP